MATPPLPPPPPPKPSATSTHSHLTSSTSPSYSWSLPTRSMDQVCNDINVTSLCDTTTRYCVGNRNSNSNGNGHYLLAKPSFDSTQQTTTLSLTFITSANDKSLPKLTQYSHHRSFFSASNNTTNKKVHQANLCTKLSDQLHQRVMKNRESALRSRARKQAYRNALEIKVAGLMEENSRLRRQVEELQSVMESSAEKPKKLALYRTSTSPF